MTENSEVRLRWWYFPALLLLAAVALAIGVSAVAALAGRSQAPAGTVSEVDSAPLSGAPPAGSSGRVDEVNPNPLAGENPASGTTGSCPGSYHYWKPQPGGPCNGCTVRVGDHFTLDLMVHSNPAGAVVHQAYFTFSHTLLQNVDVSGTGCAGSAVIQPDETGFDVSLQNEVCNGPEPCLFRGANIAPGAAAYASGALSNPPPTEQDFRVASFGLCATAPGQAVLRWEFTSPSRVTMVGDSTQAGSPQCYRDYVIDIKD